MSEIAASIIVVSRHRPAALARCITALRQQSHANIEVIVVANPDACKDLDAQTDLKVHPFDQPNIAAARNIGIGLAAGEAVLFIDDDAVAEPTWAARLIAPFADPSVVAATGFVRGRNGISYQWRACTVDHLGQDHTLEVPQTVSVHSATAQKTIKTQRTNCAFRRSSLCAIGGFDAAFAFYLDEADVCLRLATLGQTAVVPDAQVHHGYFASVRRKENRVPTTLFDIAASTAVFVRKHASARDIEGVKQRLFAAQADRVAILRRKSKISAAQGQHLMHSLENGWLQGMQRPFGTTKIPPNNLEFRPLSGTGARGAIVIAGRFWAQAALHKAAQAARTQGKIVTVVCLSPSLRRHQMQYLPAGYWWQSGGIWGRSIRDQSALLFCGFRARVKAETRRIAPYRPA